MESGQRVQAETRRNAEEVIGFDEALSNLSLHFAVFVDLDYAHLKRSFDYFVQNYSLAELVTPTRTTLALAIADFVEGTQDFCGERLADIDRDLQKRDAYTLSFLREYFTRDHQKNV